MNSRSSSLPEPSHARGEGQKGKLHGQGMHALPLADGRPELARQESLLSLMASSARLQRQCACGAPSAGGGSCSACEAKASLQGLQRKALAIGAADDPLEREADQVAERVMRMKVPSATPVDLGQHVRPMVSRSTDGAAVAGEAPASVHATLASPGQPLAPSVRAFFEPRFGADFSQVRVHTDDLAQQSARHGGLRGVMARDRQRTFGQAPILQRQEATGDTESEDHLDRFRSDPTEILNEINPQGYCRLNCPATADAFENFIRTGRIDAAHCDRDAEIRGDLGYVITGRLHGRYIVALGGRSVGRRLEDFRSRVERLLRVHGDVLVVEAERTTAQQIGRSGRRLSQYHYFVIVNIREVLFIVDAYLRLVHPFARLTTYLNDLNVSFLRYVQSGFSAVPQPHR